MENYHLTHDGESWALKKENSERATKRFTGTKEEALEQSIEFMSERTGSLKIHKQDGTIQEERTYPRSADPSSSPG